MPEINSSWVQAGELGLAFIVVILCAWLIRYTMTTSSAREKMLMDIVTTQTQTLQRMADGLEDVVSRLEAIEQKVNIRRTRKAAK